MKKNYLKPEFEAEVLELDTIMVSEPAGPLNQDDFYGNDALVGGRGL